MDSDEDLDVRGKRRPAIFMENNIFIDDEIFKICLLVIISLLFLM